VWGREVSQSIFQCMVQMPTEELQIIAVLHDVVEDSDYTFEYLAKEGFATEVVEALRALTK